MDLQWFSSRQPGFPWGTFASIMAAPDMAEPQAEDGFPGVEQVDWQAFGADPARNIFLFANGHGPLGFTLLRERGVSAMDIHASFLPHARGATAKACCLWTTAQVFCAGDTRKLRTEIPVFNRAACHLAVACGMRREGYITQTFLQRGVMHNTVLYGITREEFLVRFATPPTQAVN